MTCWTGFESGAGSRESSDNEGRQRQVLVLEIIKVALDSLRANKLRSFLTM